MPGDFALAGVVPWGRTADEYRRFFNLDDVPATARVLDCGGGPASFTAEWAGDGREVVAVDPIYALTEGEIEAAFDAVAGPMRTGMEAARDRFVWDLYGTPDDVVALRRRALRRFAKDRRSAPAERYVPGSLPELPFGDDSFDLVTCSHLLFLYGDRLDLAFHVAALREMLRVGHEVRLFPLLDLNGAVSPHIAPATAALCDEARVDRVPVGFEFQRGAREMLRLRRLADTDSNLTPVADRRPVNRVIRVPPQSGAGGTGGVARVAGAAIAAVPSK